MHLFCLGWKNKVKKSSKGDASAKKLMSRQGWSLPIRWTRPWSMEDRQEVPNGIFSTEGMDISWMYYTLGKSN